ncbi:MAG: hypothetical protein JNL11_11775 [Bdellovibrionaceae bacterium]|nr:hypothetical protein [Pseudobdellovibrionaceae bacterium]
MFLFKCVFFIVGFLFFSSVQARVVSESEYPFPFKDPWIASISSGAVFYSGSDFQSLKFEFLPDRREVPLLEMRNKISINLFQQKSKAAPLAFVIAGTGGTAFSDKALWLGHQLYQLGYHVVTLPNTINFQYVLGVSRSGVPGYTPRDAAEYYQVLKAINYYLVNDKKMQISGYSLMGYSLGGLLAGFIAREDESVGQFNFERVVMLNPALDLGFVVDALDNFYKAGNLVTEQRKENIQSQVFSVGMNIMKTGFDIKKIQTAVERMQLNENEKKWLVGDNFRSDLRDVVFATQQINDQGVLVGEVTRFEQSRRLDEARLITFEQYMNRILLPTLPSGLLVEDLVRQASIYEIENFLKSKNNVYIFTCADDFIYRPEDFKYMKNLVGDDRYVLYPHGGHVGNLWFDTTKKDIGDLMRLK